MPTFHRSRPVGRSLRRPMATPSSRVWELEQRLQKVLPAGADRGIWELLHQHLADDPDMEYLIIDSTVVRAHPCAAGAPSKKEAKQPRPWDGAAAGSAPRST